MLSGGSKEHIEEDCDGHPSLSDQINDVGVVLLPELLFLESVISAFKSPCKALNSTAISKSRESGE